MIRTLAASGQILRRGSWLTPFLLIYVLVVAVIAAAGFTAESTPLILLAALLSLPASIIALPGYYVVFGMLALIPGANPSSSSGLETCTRDRSCHETVTGQPAVWFLATMDAIGIFALASAALLNAVAVQLLIACLQGTDPGNTWGHPKPRQTSARRKFRG